MIKKIGNIILLGTSHIAKQSVKEIKDSIEKFEPEVVAIELDIDRFRGLMSKDKSKRKKDRQNFKMIRELGVSGYLFAIVAGMFQEKIGKSIGMEAGIDMKTAFLESRKRKIPTALIDINIKVTLKKISKISFRKKIAMFSKFLFSGFSKKNRPNVSIDIKKGVPDEKTIKIMMNLLKTQLPEIYNILIGDRNKYMVKKILEIKENHSGNILVVVGAGHVEGMEELLMENLKISKKVETLNSEILKDNSFNFSFKID